MEDYLLREALYRLGDALNNIAQALGQCQGLETMALEQVADKTRRAHEAIEVALGHRPAPGST
jgi:hypothetical protein